MTSPAHYAFLVLEEHPYGREMLEELLKGDFEPAVVIEESSKVSDVEREKFLERFSGFPIAPTFTELLAGRAVRRVKVKNHNRKKCREILEETKPDLLVLGGTRILKESVFQMAKKALNAHPGLLPEVRGSASVAWSIERDVEIGCTTHFIDAGVDTGPIIERRKIPVHRGDTYEKLCFETCCLSAVLMREALEAYRDNRLVAKPQVGPGETHRNMPPEGVEEVKRKLAEGRYAHFVD